MALLDGFVLHLPAMETVITRRHRWQPVAATEGRADDEWSLFAIAVESIVLNMTRPFTGTAVEPGAGPSSPAEQQHPV
jgi:hypothetical protein